MLYIPIYFYNKMSIYYVNRRFTTHTIYTKCVRVI